MSEYTIGVDHGTGDRTVVVVSTPWHEPCDGIRHSEIEIVHMPLRRWLAADVEMPPIKLQKMHGERTDRAYRRGRKAEQRTWSKR